MEIHASATFDYSTMSKWFRRSGLVRTVLYGLFAAAFIGFAVWDLIWFISDSDRQIAVPVFAILYFAFALFYVYLIIAYPKRGFKRLGNLQNAHITYVFREGNYSMTITADGLNGQEEHGWQGIKKVVECVDYIYIYLQSHQVHLVDKATVNEEDMVQLRSFFAEKFGKRFFARKN
ncbi:MAG: YcxB family protein [Clostridia bacterium]|nr:YcxB family protein [Clostridia bacterium]